MSTASEDIPFNFSRPTLLSHKPRCQVFSCQYSVAGSNSISPCVLKIFTTRDNAAYQKELAVYTLASKAKSSTKALATQLAAGAWDITRYQTFLGGKFPSALRRHETGVNVIVLSYIDSFEAFSRAESSEVRLKGVKAALRSLRALHEIGILHGDISAENTLVQRHGDVYTAVWIDFSSSIVKSSPERVASEWRNAIDYFSELVRDFRSVLMN